MALNAARVIVVAGDSLVRSSFQRLFERDKAHDYELTFAAHPNEAIAHVRKQRQDAMLLAIEGEDASVEGTLRTLASVSPDMPIIVTHGGDLKFGAAIRQFGATEAVRQQDLNALTLRLLIGYSIAKFRFGEGKIAQRKANAYELVSKAVINGWLTATQGWDPLLRKSNNKKFLEIVDAYEQVLIEWARNQRDKKRQSRAPLRHMASLIEQVGGKPSDVVDIHAHAVAKVVRGMDEAKARGAAWQSHGLALDILGRLQIVKDRAPWKSKTQRISGLTSQRRSSDQVGIRRTPALSNTRRTSEAGLLRRASEMTEQRAAAASRERVQSATFAAVPPPASQNADPRRTMQYAGSKSGDRRKSDVVAVTGRRKDR